MPSLERDTRRLDPELVIKEARALSLATEISILEESDISKVISNEDKIVVAADDVGNMLIEEYLTSQNVTKDTAFLRWHSMNSVTQMPVHNDGSISTKEFDKKMINLAQKEADKSSDWWRHVGSVLVKDGEIISTAYNSHGITENTHYIEGEPRSNFRAGKDIADLVIFSHGEATIIANAARDGVSIKGAELYVNVFPCPSCAMLIANAGISKVYYREGYSLLDAERILKNAGVELICVQG